MQERFSYIITYRDNLERRTLLFTVIDWLQSFNCETIVVEQDTEQKIDLSAYQVKHVFAFNDRDFNRSWAFNVGYKNCHTSKVVFGDADILVQPADLLDALSLLDKYDVVSPYETVMDLSADETEIFKTTNKFPASGENTRPGINLSGGIVLFNRKGFETICGWCEEFEGWGGEDDFMTWKIDAWLKSEMLPSSAFHLWHPPVQIREEAYEKNLNILRKCENYTTEQFVSWVLESKDLIGNLEKYK